MAGQNQGSGRSRVQNNSFNEKDAEDIAKVATKDYGKVKKIQLGIAYLAWALAPIITLDYWRIFKTGGWKNPFYYFLVLPAAIPIKLADVINSIASKIPKIGWIAVFPLTTTLYLFAPIKEISGYSKKEFTEKGVEYGKDKVKEKAGSKMKARMSKKAAQKAEKKAAEKSSGKFLSKFIEKFTAQFWDDGVSLASIPTGIGPIIMTIVDLPFSTATYKAMELLKWDQALVRKHPKVGGFFVTAFLPKKYDENGNVLEDFSKKKEGRDESNYKSASNNNKLVTGGGRERENWGDNNPDDVTEPGQLSHTDDDDSLISGDWSKIPWPSKGHLVGLIIGIAVLGFIGFFGVASASGGGSGYVGILGNMFGSETTQAGNAAGDLGESVGYQGSQLMQTLKCFGDAGCLKEWRLNNTREPGSEDVGESYRLRVSNLGVGVGDSINVGYEVPNDGIPISFLLSNTRNQLKGYPAKDVDYRVRIADTSLLDSDEDQCNSGWIELKKYGDLSEEGISLGEENENDWLLPGETVEPSSYEGEKVSLKDCGLLQPGPTQSYDVMVQIRYNYSSTSLLQIEAMSESHRTSEGIEIDEERSEAVRTPAQSYVKANAPMTYSRVGSGTVSQPRNVGVGVSTDKDGIEYKVNPETFNITDSSLTNKTEACDNLVRQEEDRFQLSEDSKDQIEDRQNNTWIGSRAPAISSTCSFELENPERVSQTGETLTFTAEADYRIEVSQSRKSFSVKNTRCTIRNCPTLAPITDNLANLILNADLNGEPTQDGYFDKEYAYCNPSGKQDAQDGCNVLDGDNPFRDRELAEDSEGNDLVVEEGNIAVTTEALKSSNAFTCYARNIVDYNQTVFGFDPDDLNEAVSTESRMNYTDDEWDLVELEQSSDSGSSTSCA